MIDQTEFHRLNFFTGLFTTADDWTSEQRYHLEKRKLHLRGLFTPGVIADVMEGLKAEAVEGQSAHTIRVSTGAALDEDGNLIYLPVSRTVSLDRPPAFPAIAYVLIRYNECPEDYRWNVEDPDYSGNARVGERASVAFTWDWDPDKGDKAIELGRVRLTDDSTPIKDAVDRMNPHDYEIDRRHVKRVGVKEARFGLAADTLAQVHAYHLGLQRRLNQALHTPGLLRGVLSDWDVKPVGGLTVQVNPGAALDASGNEIHLDTEALKQLSATDAPQIVYIVARFRDAFTEHLKEFAIPPNLLGGSGFDGSLCTADIDLHANKPDNKVWIELARVHLAAGAAEVRLAADPANPQLNELDRRFVIWSGARAVAEPGLDPEVRQRIIQMLRDKRREFAALCARFPVQSAADVRQCALNMELQVRADCLNPRSFTELMTMLASLEQDVHQEIGAEYPPVVNKPEFEEYVRRVEALRQALFEGVTVEVLITRQVEVTEAARQLSQVIFRSPTADAGADQSVQADDDQAQVTLDASKSQAHNEQKIVSYRWDKEQ
jgi:hypothetical protein